MRPAMLLTAPVLALALQATPALATGMGISLPKLHVLNLESADPGLALAPSTSYGGSVQVAGGTFSLRPFQVGVALDYAYTRDFERGAQYSFFEPSARLGLPLALSSQVYLRPEVDVRGLWLITTSPYNLPSWGLGPGLTLGFRPMANVAVELTLSYTNLPAASGIGQVRGTMGTLEVGGSYSF